jgi:hypothetical protein
MLVGVPIEHVLPNLLTAAFFALLAYAVFALLLCTFFRALVELYVALRETFHHSYRLPRGHARTLLELGTDSYTEVVPAPQGGRLW